MDVALSQGLRRRRKPTAVHDPAKVGTLHELAKLASVAILAEVLGCSPARIERRAVDYAAAYARYVAAVLTAK